MNLRGLLKEQYTTYIHIAIGTQDVLTNLLKQSQERTDPKASTAAEVKRPCK